MRNLVKIPLTQDRTPCSHHQNSWNDGDDTLLGVMHEGKENGDFAYYFS